MRSVTRSGSVKGNSREIYPYITLTIVVLGIVLLLVTRLVSGAPFEIASQPVYYGMYSGFDTIDIASWNYTTSESTFKLLATMNKNSTYLILVYKVPNSWLGQAELFTGPPKLTNDIRGEWK